MDEQHLHHLQGEGEVLVRAKRAELQDARSGRKHAEQNLQLLSNRIALLRQEERYAIKQIEEANKKKEIIEKRRQERIEWQRLHEEQIRQRQHEAEEIREKTRGRRKNVQVEKEKSGTSNLSGKRMIAQKTKNWSTNVDQERIKVQEEVRQQNLQRCKEAKRSREIARQKIAREQEEKRERIRSQLHKEVARENNLRKNYDTQALSFEQEEAVLLERMQSLQIEMKDTFARLDSVIADDQRFHQPPPGRSQSRRASIAGFEHMHLMPKPVSSKPAFARMGSKYDDDVIYKVSVSPASTTSTMAPPLVDVMGDEDRHRYPKAPPAPRKFKVGAHAVCASNFLSATHTDSRSSPSSFSPNPLNFPRRTSSPSGSLTPPTPHSLSPPHLLPSPSRDEKTTTKR
eukprot:gene553-626_t